MNIRGAIRDDFFFHDNLCVPTIKSDTGQHSQFLQCFNPNVQLFRKYIGNKKQEMCWETKIATKGFSLLLQNGKLVPESSPSAGSVYLLIYFQTHDDFHCADYESHVDNNDDVSVISVLASYS